MLVNIHQSSQAAGRVLECFFIHAESIPLDRGRYTLRVDELIGFVFGNGEIVTADMLPEDEWRVEVPWVFSLKDKP